MGSSVKLDRFPRTKQVVQFAVLFTSTTWKFDIEIRSIKIREWLLRVGILKSPSLGMFPSDKRLFMGFCALPFSRRQKDHLERIMVNAWLLGPHLPKRSLTLLVKNKLKPFLFWMIILLSPLRWKICGRQVSLGTHFSSMSVSTSSCSWIDSQQLLSAWMLTPLGPLQLSFYCSE